MTPRGTDSQRLAEMFEGLTASWERIAVDGLPGSISTSHRDLDRLTGGGQPGQLWTLNGDSGANKTIFALGLARHAAIRLHRSVDWISTTEHASALAEVVLSAEAVVPLHDLRFGRLSDEHHDRLRHRMGTLAEVPLRFTEAEPIEVAMEVIRSRRTTLEPGLLILDALRTPTDTSVLAELRWLARLHRSWVVVVAPDLPGTTTHDAVRAQASVADIVLWLDRPTYDNGSTFDAALRIVRSRRGPTATVNLLFLGHRGRFDDVPAS